MLNQNECADAFVAPIVAPVPGRRNARPGRHHFVVLAVVVVLVLAVVPDWRGARATTGDPPELTGAARLSLPFVENAGQLPPPVAFSTPIDRGTLFVTHDGVLVHALVGAASPRGRSASTSRTAGTAAPPAHSHDEELWRNWSLVERFARRQSLLAVGVVPAHTPVTDLRTTTTGAVARSFDVVEIKDAYEGVDVRLVSRASGVEKVFVVAAGSDPGRIVVSIDGALDLSAGSDGELIAQTGVGPVVFTAPCAYQERDGMRVPVPVSYRLVDDGYAFAVGAYDASLPLVIDPLVRATHIGAPVAPQDYGHSIAIDPASGDVLIAGNTFSTSFPGTTGGAQANNAGSADYFVVRLSGDLRALIQATYLGGTASETGAVTGAGALLAIDVASGDILVAGQTGSSGFPGTGGAAQPTGSGSDSFVARLSADLRTLRQATYVAGIGSVSTTAIAIHPADGSLYVAGYTSGTTLPGSSGGAQPVSGGDEDGFVMRFNGALTSRLQASYFGGSGADRAVALAIDPADGDVLIAGYTASTDLPGIAGRMQSAYGGTTDGFVARLDAGLSALRSATYVGGSGMDVLHTLAIDVASGDVVAAGQTRSMDLPGVSGGAQGMPSGDLAFQTDGFLVRIDETLTNRIGATYFGGTGEDDVKSLAIAAADGEVFAAGITSSTNLPGRTGGAQAGLAGSMDVFVARFSPQLSTLRQSTYLGGSNTDVALSLAIDAATGDLLVGGYTQSANFPGTSGSAQPTGAPAGFPDAFVARLTRDLAAIGAPASIVAHDGTPQSAALGSTFAQRLVALVRDANLTPIPGVSVTFQLPASGARAEFPSEGYVAAATTDAFGVATSPLVRAMGTVGSYSATATVAGVATPALFVLTNTAGPPASVFAIAGTPQSAAAGAAFPVALQAKVTDSGTNPVAGVAVTFALPASGPTGTFPGGVSSVVATTDGAGVATSPIVSAGAAAGAFDATATVSGVGSATFALTVTTAADVRLVALEGGLQYAVIGQPYAQRIRVKAVTGIGTPIAGHAITVSFPASGASASFAGQSSVVMVTGADGIATSPEFLANGIVGTFDAMTDDATATSTDPAFRLTNTGMPATIQATGGSSQVAYMGERFARPLQATVRDGSGQTVPGVTVAFSAPSNGPSAGFSVGGTTTTAVTDSMGVATALGVIAGTTRGTYVVEAVAAGIAHPATFDLTNSPDDFAIAVASGDAHACVLTFVGGVMCWGRNGQGQLGRGTIGGSDGTPQPVLGLASGVVAISAGASHTCAIESNGAVKCWGGNDVGQLGRSTANGNPDGFPAVVSGLSEPVVAVSAGEAHTCVVTTAGAAKCWGSNSSGQLGRGTVGLPSAVPQDVAGLGTDAIAITAGGLHSCAATSTGSVKCWGSNISGQLGRGTSGGQDGTPQDVVGLGASVRSIASGRLHSCALTAAGGLKCWGTNGYGELGRGSAGGLDGTPRDVVGLTTGVALGSLGRSHSCALMATGSPGGAVKCWGANFSAQLGRGTIGAQDGTPADVVDLPLGASAIASGGTHTCALATGGRVACWGYNSEGQLGRGTSGPEPASAPRDVRLPPEVTALSLGQSHACALRDQGRVSCWGANYQGQAGQPNTGTAVQGVPRDVSGLTGLRAVSGGGSHSCAVTGGGGVKCWGDNNSGQVGRGSTGGQYDVPQDVSGLASGVVAVSAGGYHSCAVTVTNGLKCWGDNSSGQLGRGTSGGADGTPQDVSGLGNVVVAVSAGQLHTCAVMRDGSVACWGDNGFGQLGRGTVGGQSATPQAVTGLASGAIALSAGGLHTCAVLVDGGLACWGSNSTGTLGRGTTGGSDGTPQLVVGLANGALAVAAGYSHTCAATAAGAAKCWGNDAQGKLGRVGVGGNYSVPQDVAGLASGVIAIGVGIDNSCAVTRDGRVWCWGRNDTGMLGNGYAPILARATDTVALQTSSQEISGAVGTPQTASNGAAFATPLSIIAHDLEGRTGNEGVPVYFSLLREGTTGAGGSFPGNAINVVVPVALGRAVSPPVVANANAGSWKAVARMPGGRSIAEFALTNAASSIATIDVVGGAPQSAVLSTPFAAPVVVRAKDAGGNPIAGVDVTLTPPPSGASAAVLPAMATTGADGRAQFDVGANAIGGAYALTASALSGAVQKRLPMLNVLGPARMELGDAHSCMVTDSGTVKCWGRNVEGQLGRGATSASEMPADVAGLSGAVAVASGGYFSCALLANGSVTCWGDNTYGQVGQGSAGGIVPTASPVAGLTGIVAIAAGTEFACALDNAGAVRCWGRNHVGQTGTGAATVGANLALPTAVPELVSGVAAIAAGGGRACAVMVGGNVKCWGSNAAGSLGLGTAGGYEPSPRDVTGVSEVATIGMGGEHACVITSAGTLKCWGNNFSGQVGVLPIGSEVHAPVDVPDLLDDLVAVHLGSSFTCVLARDGYVKCWGANDRGQLGSGIASAPRAAKQPPIGLTQGVVTLATGFDHACARLATGSVRCWGANTEGQAHGGTSDDLVPAFVGGLPGTPAVIQFVGGSPQNAAVSAAFADPLRVRVVDALGSPVPGVLVEFASGGTQASARLSALGGGGADSSVGVVTDAAGYASVLATANEFPGSYTVTATVAGLPALGAVPFALLNLGTVSAIHVAGGGAQSAQIGSPFRRPIVVRSVDSAGNPVPGVQVTLLPPPTGATAVLSQTTVTTGSDGTAQVSATAGIVAGAYAVEVSATGAIGARVSLRNTFARRNQVAAGAFGTCAIDQGGGARCWGWNDHGQLGDGSTIARATPAAVSGLAAGIAGVYAGGTWSCAVGAAGDASCWGNNQYGQLGDGTMTTRLTPVTSSAAGSPVIELAAGNVHGCAIGASGGLRCWGLNDTGGLGNGTQIGSASGVDVTGMASGVATVSVGNRFTCALLETGGPRCWGGNYRGTLGDGTQTDRLVPVEVLGLGTDSVAIASGGQSSCAVQADGGVKCWGSNEGGVLGDGTTTDSPYPVAVPGLAGVVELAIGQGHACALLANGSVRCWGLNFAGQLGDGTTSNRLAPTDVVGLAGGIVALATGAFHTCAVRGDGAMLCWGQNFYGQLGDGTTTGSAVPVFVRGFAGAPAAISVANGSGQSAQVDSDFVIALQASVTDSGGNAVQGAMVTFTVPTSGSGGTFSGQITATASTNSGGIATAPQLRANTSLGTWTATATVAGVATPATFALTNLPGAPASLAIAGTPQTTLTGTLFPQTLDVTVSDAWGNKVPGVNVTFTSPPTGASGNFPGNVRTTVVPTNASGVASTTITANGTAGTFTVQGTVTGLAATSFALTSVPRTGTTITPVSGAQTTVVGTAFAGPLVAVVKDAGNNPVPNLTVTFTLPNGTLSAAFPGNARTAVALTDANGVASSPQPITATTRSGTFVARAAVAGVATTANFSMTNVPGAPATIAARVGGQSAAVYTTFNNAPSVRVADAYNNPVPGQNVTFALPSSGPTGAFQGQPNPVVVVTDAMGIATAPKVDANGIVGAYQATATAAPIAAPATFNLTNTVGAGAKFTVEAGSPQSVVVAQPFAPLEVKVLDAVDRPVEGVRITFSLPGSAASATFPGNVRTDVRYTDAAGRATSPIPTATTRSGSFTATARAAGIASALSFALTNLPDVPATAAANGVGGQTATVYQPFARAPSVRVRDQYNNGVPGVQVTFVLPAAGPAGAFVDGAVSPLVVATDATGVATAPLVKANGVVGVWYVSVSAAGIATPVTFRMTNVVGAGATVTSSPGTTPQSTARGTLFPVRLAARVADALGNPVEGVNVTFTLPPGTAGARFGPAFTARTAVVATGPDGIATAPDAKATATAGSYMATAAAAGVTGSATFDLTNN